MNRTRAARVGLILLGAGCSSGPTDPNEIIVGVYALSTINGEALPFVWVSTDPQNQVSFASGTLTLKADGTFTDQTTFTILINGTSDSQTISTTGTWSLEGSTLTLTPTEQEPYPMTWDGSDQLTQNFDDLILLYKK